MPSYTVPSRETLKALETAPNIYLILSPDLYILTASDLYLEATETKREVIVGKHIFEAFPENPELPDADGVQNINASLQEVLKTKKPHRMRIQRYDVPDLESPGKFIQRYWDPSHTPILDENGAITYIIQLANNITDKVLSDQTLLEQIEVQKKLEASEKHFKQLADIVPAKISNALPSGEVTFFNQKWLDYAGMSFEDLRDFGYHEMMHPDEIPVFKKQLGEAAAKGVALESEMRFKDLTGNYRWHLNIASPVLNNKGEITMWVGSTTDIQRIKEEDGRLQQLINMLPASVVVIRGDDLVVEMINQSNLDYWNRKAEEVVGRKFLDILPDLADQPFAGQLRHVMATGEVIDVKESPVLFENEDGTIRETFVDYTYQPLTDLNGERNGVLVMSFEITDRVASRRLLEAYADELQAVNDLLTDSNRELELSEQRFKYLIQEAPVAIGVLTGRELIVSSANAKLLEVWGKPASIIGLPLSSALPELEGQPFLQILDNVYTKGEAFNANEIRAFLEHEGDLKEMFFNVVYQPIQREQGNTSDILVVAVDVTVQVNARKAVERAEESLRLSIEAADSGTYSINARTFEFTASPRLKELFGFKANEDMPYEACMTQIRDDYRPLAYQMVEAAVTKGERFDLVYPVIGFHDGRQRWLRGVGTLQHDSNGVDSYFTGIINDITEQKEDEQRKNDFITMVSHELKTPITSLNGYLQVLEGRAKKAEDTLAATFLEKSVKQVRKMTDMINGFLNMSRLESGKIHIDKQPFDMADLVKEAEEESLTSITTHHIIFAPVEPTPVVADRDKIGQVITNLINNAVKYSPHGSTINVACVTANNIAMLSVQDEGIGIAAADTEKLFERYFRVESSATRSIAGFGIGLYFCKEIVERHEGTIAVKSEVGEGSTFYFTLPVSVE